jgi:hypothetical protein
MSIARSLAPMLLRPGNADIEIELIETLISARRNHDAAVMCDQALQTAAANGDQAALPMLAMLRRQCDVPATY